MDERCSQCMALDLYNATSSPLEVNQGACSTLSNHLVLFLVNFTLEL